MRFNHAIDQSRVFRGDTQDATWRPGLADGTDGPDSGVEPDGGYSIDRLRDFVRDLSQASDWREMCALDHAFYDGDQLKSETLRRMRELGVPPVTVNMIGSMIRAVAGFEVVTRPALTIKPETNEDWEMATAMNVEFTKALNMTRFNTWLSQAFLDCLVGGISWIEVVRETDPFKYRYKVCLVPWEEMHHDPRSKRLDLEDDRFRIRRRWFDLDILQTHFPKHKKEIAASIGVSADTTFGVIDEYVGGSAAESLMNGYERDIENITDRESYLNLWRKRLPLYEILYRVPKTVDVLRLAGGAVIELERDNPMHLEALRTNAAVFQRGITTVWRQAWFAGPTRLADAPLPTNRPHYIPMVCFRRNSDYTPYGLVKDLRSPQESFNARYSRNLYDLSGRKYTVDEDAVHDHAQTAEELNKVNSYVVLKADRVNRDPINQLPNAEMAPVLHGLMMEAKQNFQDVTGITPEFRGMLERSGQSGISISSLIEQTRKVFGSIVDNYRNSKEMAGEALMDLLVKDIAEYDNYAVPIGEGQNRRQIVMNVRDEATGGMNNALTMARLRLDVSEIPESQTYQEQRFMILSEIVKSMPPEMQVSMLDLVIEAASLPDGEEILERIKLLTGFGPEPKDPEKAAQLNQALMQKQQMEQMMADLEIRVRAAEAELSENRALHEEARAFKTAGADTRLTESKAEVELQKAREVGQKAGRDDLTAEAKLVEATARLRQAQAAADAAKNRATESGKKGG